MQPLRELAAAIAHHAARGGSETWTHEESGLRFVKVTRTAQPSHRVYEPVLAIVAQGEKEIILGDRAFTCGEGSCLVVSVDLPITFRISRATRAEPYLALAMRLKPAAVAALLLEAPLAERPPAPTELVGMGKCEAPLEVLEAVARLVRLLDEPRDLAVLGPIAEKEILWRLLRGEQGARLRQIGLADSRLSQIGRAMRVMRESFREALPIEDLARVSAMSVTSFHRHFRAVALMTPLQYLKQIRLQEARAQLLVGATDVASIGHAVGYESPSQFSREYKRAYGSPPGEDARLLRAAHRRAARANPA